jgi:hypothetical protein
MARPEYKSRFSALLAIGIWLFSSAVIAHAGVPLLSATGTDPMREIGTQTSASAPAQTVDAPARSAIATTSATPGADHAARVRARRAARREARRKALAASSPAVEAHSVPASPTPSQHRVDQQILAEEKARSAETARENDALTRRLVHDQDRQQDEQRIQDAPGPGAEPLAGDPAIPPAQTGDAPRIQDAPGPAQTLPQAPPPPATTPTAAPAQTAPRP